MRLSTILRMRKSDNGRTPENAEEGIYVYSIDGYLYTKDEWNTNNNGDVVGIGVIKNNHKFVIDITGVKGHNSVFVSGNGATTVPKINNFNDAAVSYVGYENTQYSLNNDHEYAPAWTKNSAVYLCNEYVFKNGNKGYLLASGELQIVIENQVEINDLLLLVGGTQIDFNVDYAIITSTPQKFNGSDYVWGYKKSKSTTDIVGEINVVEGQYNSAFHFVCCKF